MSAPESKWAILIPIAWILGSVAFGTYIAFQGATSVAYAFGRPPVGSRCAAAMTAACVATEPAVVRSNDGQGGLRLRLEQGTISVKLEGVDAPQDEAHVEVERWHGRVVAVYDRRAGRRYRADTWPSGWSDAGVGLFAIVVGLWFAGPAVGMALIEAVKRRRG